ncbi:MAG: hypothetical protein V4515_04550 [Chloroflexota bacterium]
MSPDPVHDDQQPAPELPAGAVVAPRGVYRLEIDAEAHPDLAGVWMRVTSASLGQLLEWGFGQGLRRDPAEVFRGFAAALIEWNLHDPATLAPVPPTWEGLLSLDHGLARRLMIMWREALTGVDAPFGGASSGGPPAPPMPIPMTPTAS